MPAGKSSRLKPRKRRPVDNLWTATGLERLFINLTPLGNLTGLTLLIPHSLKGEGEEILERDEVSLLPTLPLPLLREEGQEDGLLDSLIEALIVFDFDLKGKILPVLTISAAEVSYG